MSKQLLSLLFLVMLALSGCGSSHMDGTSQADCPRLSHALASPQSNWVPSPGEERDLAVEGGTTRARVWMAQPGPLSSQKLGVVFVSGVDGGFIEPVDGIYDRVASRFQEEGISSIFVQYRDPGNLEPSVADARAAIRFLEARGAATFAILGWSFGGAVIVNTTAALPEIKTVVGFAPQSMETEAIAQFHADQSILLFHSDTDENVPFESSQQILDEAPAFVRKRFVPLSGADHLLEGRKDEIDPVVIDWLGKELVRRAGSGGLCSAD